MTCAVVGGGIIGLSIAWRLVRRGVDVTVYDAGTDGAWWVAAGMLAAGGEATVAQQAVATANSIHVALAVIAAAVLGSHGVDPDDLPAERVFTRLLRNDDRRNRQYVLYVPARRISGTWTETRCGAPYNDGTEVVRLRGTYSTLSELGGIRVHECGTTPRDRVAARLAAQDGCGAS